MGYFHFLVFINPNTAGRTWYPYCSSCISRVMVRWSIFFLSSLATVARILSAYSLLWTLFHAYWAISIRSFLMARVSPEIIFLESLRYIPDFSNSFLSAKYPSLPARLKRSISKTTKYCTSLALAFSMAHWSTGRSEVFPLIVSLNTPYTVNPCDLQKREKSKMFQENNQTKEKNPKGFSQGIRILGNYATFSSMNPVSCPCL